MTARTHTRTHTNIAFANPYLRCDRCRAWVTAWHNPDRCGCGENGWQNQPCGHRAGATTVCPSWGPVDGCRCQPLDHPVPPKTTEDGND
jgi:hypothetical protein